MGLLKGCLKVVGSAVLTATGTASAILKGCADATGAEGLSDLLGAAKDASFDGIRNMWGLEYDPDRDIGNSIENATRKRAEEAQRIIQERKEYGDL